MGEYANRLDGENVKIGTCEDMYYLRADQLDQLAAGDRAKVVREASELRFRFPFPDEDSVAVGDFNDYGKTVGLYITDEVRELLDKVDHSKVQFKTTQPHGGVLIMLPCHLGPADQREGLNFMLNGYGGDVKIVQQRVWEHMLVLVMECGGCGAKFRLPTFADAEPFIVNLRTRADHEDRFDKGRGIYYNALADRITAGYLNPPAWIQ